MKKIFTIFIGLAHVAIGGFFAFLSMIAAIGIMGGGMGWNIFTIGWFISGLTIFIMGTVFLFKTKIFKKLFWTTSITSAILILFIIINGFNSFDGNGGIFKFISEIITLLVVTGVIYIIYLAITNYYYNTFLSNDDTLLKRSSK